MTIKAEFFEYSPEDGKTTIEWLNKTGIAEVKTFEELCNLGVIEIQLRETPAILSYFSQLENTLSIWKITSEGIVFYITDIPLHPEIFKENPRIYTESADGCVFCPMSNVVCINTF